MTISSNSKGLPGQLVIYKEKKLKMYNLDINYFQFEKYNAPRNLVYKSTILIVVEKGARKIQQIRSTKVGIEDS